MYSKKLSVQLLGEMLYNYGVRDIVISPGSRNAPLTIHFSQHKEYNNYSVVDERSAAFFALGIAQSKRKPVAICCTSGTASANYYPAIIEAFYQNVPLLVLTADRPESFVDIFDGQTIRQKEIYKNHILESFQIEESEDDASITENFIKIKKAIHTAIIKSGPIHINIPFSEPLYEQVEELGVNIEKLALPEKQYASQSWDSLLNSWNTYDKKMILLGMQPPNKELKELLERLADRKDTIILTEITSNLSSDKFYPNIDRYIFPFGEEKMEEFKPDLLLTIGQNVVSKKIKSFLRGAKLKAHWHLDEYWHPDTFFALTEKIQDQPVNFLKELVKIPSINSDYSFIWEKMKESKEIRHQEYLKNIPFSDLKVTEILNDLIPDKYSLQISNSSMIRYTQLFNFNSKREIYCNRGASGIDGSTSTAVGFSVASLNPTVLITGDIGFFYDSNALWNKYIPSSFRIILINNGGGDIFKIIPGPDTSEALDEFFVTQHTRTAKLLAEEYNFEYNQISTIKELKDYLPLFFIDSDLPKLLEIDTKKEDNAKVLRKYFEYLNPNI